MTDDIVVQDEGSVIRGHTITWRPEKGYLDLLDYETGHVTHIRLDYIKHYYTPEANTRPNQPTRWRVYDGQTVGFMPHHDIEPEDVDAEEPV